MTRRRNKPWIEPEGDYDPSDDGPPELCLFCPECNTTLCIDQGLLMYCAECGWPSADTPTIVVRPPAGG